MPLTPEEQEEFEARFQALEDRNAKLERLLRSGRAFTNNPLALATDLDDLGSVKTHLDFEEAPLTPVNPPAEVGRISGVGRTGVNDTSLRYIDKDGNISEVTHPPAVQTVSAGDLSANNNTWTSTIYSSADAFDTDSMHDTVTNTSRITINTAGIYALSGVVSWVFSATGQRAARFFLNGTTSIRQVTADATAATVGNDQLISMLYNLAVTDYVELQVWHNRGSALSVDSATKFEAVWVAPAP